MIDNLTLKTLAEDDRPREKFIQKGRHNLSNAELLAILIRSGTRSKTAIQVGQELMQNSNNLLENLGKLDVQQLRQTKGIGLAKATAIMAAMELGRRRSNETPLKKIKIQSSMDAFEILRHSLSDLGHEEFHIILLNRANIVIDVKRISVGGTSGTVADGKLIFKEALLQKASGIILAHNHPSGNLKPSDADLQLTRKMVEFGKFIDLLILDHLILTDNSYFSFADEGLLT